MRISKSQLLDLIHYVELEEAGKLVHAGLLRQSANFDMRKALNDFRDGKLEIMSNES